MPNFTHIATTVVELFAFFVADMVQLLSALSTETISVTIHEKAIKPTSAP